MRNDDMCFGRDVQKEEEEEDEERQQRRTERGGVQEKRG